jgi:hypothetical protein
MRSSYPCPALHVTWRTRRFPVARISPQQAPRCVFKSPSCGPARSPAHWHSHLVVQAARTQAARGTHGRPFAPLQKAAGSSFFVSSKRRFVYRSGFVLNLNTPPPPPPLSKLAVALRITPDLPDDSVIETWFAEPVRLLLISSDTFLTNRNAYCPVPN